MDFGSIKNVGFSVVDSIVNERKNNGEFKNFTDFCERMSGEAVNKRCIESLIKAGAFDEFGDTRATLLASFEGILDTINNSNKKGYQGQVTMFDLGGEESNLNDIKYNFIVLPELSERDLLSLEKEMLGIYISGHPLEKYREKINKITNIDTLKMSNLIVNDEETQNVDIYKMDGKQVKIAGIVTSVKKKFTKRNTTMAFVTIEDLYGNAELIVFDSCYAKCSDKLLIDNIVLVEGKLSIREDEEPKIVANNIINFLEYNEQSYDVKREDKPKEMIIDITNLEESIKVKLRGAIRFFSGERNNLLVKVKDKEKILPCGGIFANKEIIEQFIDIVGEERITLK